MPDVHRSLFCPPLLLSLLLIGVWLSMAGPAAAEDYRRVQPERHRAALEVLADYTTRDALDAFVGSTPNRCIDDAPGRQVCQWDMNRRHAGWTPLAIALETSRTIALVCSLPSSGAPREGEDCFAVPRESNRGKFRVAPRGNKNKRINAKDTRGLKEQYQMKTQALLAEATTFFELVRLVGAVPDRCEPLSEGERRCIWRTHNRTYGHGTLAATIRANMSKKVRLECALPTTAGPRAGGSCHVVIGS